MPKPDLTALTGGYRRTPVMQVGADIYCDTALIARLLEQTKSTPALFPEGREAAATALAQFADQVLFQHAVAINFQPHGLAARFAGAPEAMVKGFMADRQKLFQGGSASRLEAPVALSQWPTLLGRLETQLQRDGEYLLGSQACIADFAYYHPLWFVASNKAVANMLEGYPAVADWMARIADFGHGSHTDLDAGDAVQVAREATPRSYTAIDFVPWTTVPIRWSVSWSMKTPKRSSSPVRMTAPGAYRSISRATVSVSRQGSPKGSAFPTAVLSGRRYAERSMRCRLHAVCHLQA